MWIVCGIVLGYLIGTINPSYLIGKIKGMDIREKGSGNAGGSNALIVMGKAIGFACMLFDIAKACLAVLIMNRLAPESHYAGLLSGVFCILGHMFPFYMNFRGGKGLACLGGSILAYSWKLFFIMLAIALILVIITDYICIAPIAASIAWPILYGYMEKDMWGTLILLIATLAILLKHVENLKRIKKGTEAHFSFLWKRDEETERVKKNMSK